MSAFSAAAQDEDGDIISALRAENDELRQAAECLRDAVIRWATRAEQAEEMLEAIGADGVGSLTPRQISEQDIVDSALLGNIESPFNACMHQEHCKRWKAKATAAPQPPAVKESLTAHQPLTDQAIRQLYETPEIGGSQFDWPSDMAIAIARAVEAAHGIKEGA
jgi:hypothetical protein